jgi:hypothetical protein
MTAVEEKRSRGPRRRGYRASLYPRYLTAGERLDQARGAGTITVLQSKARSAVAGERQLRPAELVRRSSIARKLDHYARRLPKAPELVFAVLRKILQASASGPTVVQLRARPRAGAALALVHRLDASDRDGATLLDQIGGQRLGLGKAIGPRVAATE